MTRPTHFMPSLRAASVLGAMLFWTTPAPAAMTDCVSGAGRAAGCGANEQSCGAEVPDADARPGLALDAAARRCWQATPLHQAPLRSADARLVPQERAVPLPTPLLLPCGLGLIGFMARRRLNT